MYCFKQILEVASYKTPVVWPLTFHLKNYSSKMNKNAGYCWRSKDKLISHVLLWAPTQGDTSLGQLTKTYINQLCVDNGCSLKELPVAIDNRDGCGERERAKGIHAISIMMMIIMIYIY